jgi:glycosyltransferase involved in cell wall biosynthesis
VRIGVNAHLLPHGPTYRSAGVATYERELMRRLPRIGPQHEFVFFTPPGWAHGCRSGGNVVASRLPTSNPLVRIGWEQTVAPFSIRRHGIDLLHSPVNVSPLFGATPSIVTLHDLAFLRVPDRFSPAKRFYLRAMVNTSIRRAAHVITPSDYTKQDVVQAFGLSPDRIAVIPEGVGEQFTPHVGAPRPIAGAYLLFVGTIEPRKNLPILLRAYARLKSMGYTHRLALVGAPGWMYDEVYSSIRSLGLSDSVVVPGFVEDLAPWYNHADLFVYPSAYEGFGLPPLEAMACGTPVVLSSAGSLREVAGEAALFVSPSDVADLVQAFRSILDDAGQRERLIRAGLKRAAMFSWDETIRRTIEIYDAVREDINATVGGAR